MDFIEDVTKSFKASLYDRVTSPLSGTFLLSWMVINWKIMVVLFVGVESGGGSRINFIQTQTSSPGWFWPMLIFPLLSALFLTILYPAISLPIYKISRSQHNKKMAAKKKLDDEEPLTREQETKIRADIAMIRDENRQLREQRERDDEAFAIKRADLEKQIEELRTQLETHSEGSDKVKDAKEIKNRFISKVLGTLMNLGIDGEVQNSVRRTIKSVNIDGELLDKLKKAFDAAGILDSNQSKLFDDIMMVKGLPVSFENYIKVTGKLYKGVAPNVANEKDARIGSLQQEVSQNAEFDAEFNELKSSYRLDDFPKFIVAYRSKRIDDLNDNTKSKYMNLEILSEDGELTDRGRRFAWLNEFGI
jgi:hypothetical protein